MSDFPRGNAELNRRIQAATSSAEVHELIKAAMIADGVISADRGFETDVTVHRMPVMEQSSDEIMSASRRGTPTHFKVIYPGGNARIEIMGMSDDDLDSQEQKIRQRYQK
jgi:hypothetical protein